VIRLSLFEFGWLVIGTLAGTAVNAATGWF
jgi:hypothetical protein